ncbi:unnamed protein product [Caenorhabditis nigoni]
MQVPESLDVTREKKGRSLYSPLSCSPSTKRHSYSTPMAQWNYLNRRREDVWKRISWNGRSNGNKKPNGKQWQHGKQHNSNRSHQPVKGKTG